MPLFFDWYYSKWFNLQKLFYFLFVLFVANTVYSCVRSIFDDELIHETYNSVQFVSLKLKMNIGEIGNLHQTEFL